MSSEEYAWLDSPLHLNLFKGMAEEDLSDIKESLKITVDGSIMAVLLSKVKSLYYSEEVDLVKAGYKKPPNFKINDKDSFYRALAYEVTL